MFLLYIVDGYNVIHRSRKFEKDAKSDARLTFLSYLSHYRPHGSANNRLIVVFDGYASLTNHFGLEVIFSQTQTADEKIKELVRDLSKPQDAIVVTDDRDLGFSIRTIGGRWMGTIEFLDKGKAKKHSMLRKESGIDREEKSNLNIVQREAITEELKNIWLKKKSS